MIRGWILLRLLCSFSPSHPTLTSELNRSLVCKWICKRSAYISTVNKDVENACEYVSWYSTATVSHRWWVCLNLNFFFFRLLVSQLHVTAMIVDVFLGPCFVEKEMFQFEFRLPYTLLLLFHYRRVKSSRWFRRNVQASCGHFRPFRGKSQCFKPLSFEEEHLQHVVPENLDEELSLGRSVRRNTPFPLGYYRDWSRWVTEAQALSLV